MTKRMLIDATHAEETRVVVLDGNRLEDFDVETATKRHLKGNIYLAKVVRVEPSLQAAFVEYGGNRHGFLAFDEIHPDYYQIPVADRERLLAMQAEQARREEEQEDREAERDFSSADEPSSDSTDGFEAASVHQERASEDASFASPQPEEPSDQRADQVADQETDQGTDQGTEREGGAAQPLVFEPERLSAPVHEPPRADSPDQGPADPGDQSIPAVAETGDESGATVELLIEQPEQAADPAAHPGTTAETQVPDETDTQADAEESGFDRIEETPPPETIGGEHDTMEESRERRIPPRLLRNYKIQEVIRRRQILLVQVVKEERGTKGAALTTYISLAGRYCVLMPNSPRGGGISRKITSAADRRRLKEVMAELDLPEGMGLIVRTAGANRPKPEIKRDCEYLLRLWDDIREHTMRSVAPALIYEEASLIKRAIRDVYSRDIDEIAVDGEDGWRAARDFMRMLMPTHVKKVQLWRDGQPLFARHQVDAQLDAMLSPTVQLRSGGYLVIDQTEALVAIDVNSGRSTRERGIEETALRTNQEAADEVARQLRLRDLAGLIVIDFIDMESKKHNGMVERRLKDALKADRARIQLGHISHFGLLEMSRQRLRPSLAETSFVTCPHCGGTGHVRSTESAAIHVLRGIEEEGTKRRAAEIVVHTAAAIAMYIFNHKRDRLTEIEARYGMRVTCAADETLLSPQFRIERVRAQTVSELPAAITAGPGHLLPQPEDETEVEEPEDWEESPAEGVQLVLDTAGPRGTDASGTDEGDAPSDTPSGEIDEETGEQVTENRSRPVLVPGETAEETERHRRRRRRRRRGGRHEETPAGVAEPGEPVETSLEQELAATHIEGVPEHAEPSIGEEERARRRSRRGGRRRRRDGENLPGLAEPGADQPEVPAYAGPTPADPFGGAGYDIFDVLEEAEHRSATQSETPALPVIAGPPPTEPIPDLVPEPSGLVETSDAAPELDPPPVEGVLEREPIAAPPAPANDREAEPAITPIVVGEDSPVAEKKRGWWRR